MRKKICKGPVPGKGTDQCWGGLRTEVRKMEGIEDDKESRAWNIRGLQDMLRMLRFLKAVLIYSGFKLVSSMFKITFLKHHPG